MPSTLKPELFKLKKNYSRIHGVLPKLFPPKRFKPGKFSANEIIFMWKAKKVKEGGGERNQMVTLGRVEYHGDHKTKKSQNFVFDTCSKLRSCFFRLL